LEEGFSWEDLETVLKSIKKAAKKARVEVTAGDTKVVRRGQADKIYINTSGVGTIQAKPAINKIRPGDKIILTGTLGEEILDWNQRLKAIVRL
jgi:hydrogenase expression/formation protein HypE